MPDIARIPYRLDCKGIDLVNPIDRMPEGYFSYLFNVRQLTGPIEGRPGYARHLALSDPPNSIRRLNDPSRAYAPDGYIYVGGGGTNLYAGVPGNYTQQDSGYTGNPLALIPFRPDQSPESWMYVYDENKLVKIRPDKTIYPVGIAPPVTSPVIEYGIPSQVDIFDGQSNPGFSLVGDASAITALDRTLGSAPTISNLLYNTGTTGWCCINPSSTPTSWMGDRMKVTLDQGGANEEVVVVREVHKAVENKQIQSVEYDAGTTGMCSIVIQDSPNGMARNSLVTINAELIRVLEVNPSPDGIGYSIRCFTASTVNPGDFVVGLLSWYVYTNKAHLTGESITSNYLKITQSVAGTGAITLAATINAGTARFRPVSIANDYLHISFFVGSPNNLGSLQLLLSLDSTPNFSFTNPGNSLLFTFGVEDLMTAGLSADSWCEIVVPISQATRTGSDFTRGLADISGISLQVVSTASCDWSFDWWYLFGTYGPTIQPNSPVGMVYQTRFRDVSTGAKSVPGPVTRYALFPLREAVIITPVTTTQVAVTSCDIYRMGGSVNTPLYVGTAENDPVTPLDYLDSLTDLQVLTADQPPDLTAIQPWPLLQRPWRGHASVSGTTVKWLSGDKFNTALISNSVILLNGSAYQTHGQPVSDEFIELTLSAGAHDDVIFQVGSPTLAGQPLPLVFGALEGPFAPVLFALGDPINGGLLYFTNYSDADSCAGSNTLELSTPSQDLVSGAVWNGLAICGSREQLFGVRYSYLSSANPLPIPYQWATIPAPSGIWSRWACCSTPIGVAYLGKDGIYLATDAKAVNITDEKLYPMFPHDGAPAKAVTNGDNTIYPVDMTQYQFLNLTYCDETIRFAYKDTAGNTNTLIYEIYRNRWLLNNYNNGITRHYLVEADSKQPTDQEILMLSYDSHAVMKAGGNTDDGAAINSLILTPAASGGDDRSQKLWVDTMVDVDHAGTYQVQILGTDGQYQIAFTGPVTKADTLRKQTVVGNITQLAPYPLFSLYRNACAKIAWTGGPDGPRFWAVEFTGFIQPYLTTHFATQINPFSFPGWKHMRRCYPAIISCGDVLMKIKTQDGRVYGPYTIPNTNMQYRILPFMLDQNIKDLAFSLDLDGQGLTFAFFPGDFTIETKSWLEETYIQLAVFRA